MLGLLYEAEQKGQTIVEIVADLPAAPEPYATELALGVAGRIDELDELVARHANSWALDRLPAVDRQLLRIGAYELIAQATVPVAVVIDEAVELAKTFSTEESGRFVNGVLSAIAHEFRPDDAVSP